MQISVYTVRNDTQQVSHWVYVKPRMIGPTKHSDYVVACTMYVEAPKARVSYNKTEHRYPTCLWCARIEYRGDV